MDKEIQKKEVEKKEYRSNLEKLDKEIQKLETKKDKEIKIELNKLKKQLKECQEKREELENQLAKLNQGSLEVEIYEIQNLKLNIEQFINSQEQKLKNKLLKADEMQQIKLCIEYAKNDRKILDLRCIIIELKNNKNALKHSTNKELQDSIITNSSRRR